MENTNNANDWQDKEEQWQANAANENRNNLRDRDEDEADDDNEDEEEEQPKTDWGDVDPLEHQGPSTDMDPSGPGSAV